MRIALAFCATSLLLISSSAAPEQQAVSFTVLNRWGVPHKYKVLHFRQVAKGLDLVSRFDGLQAFDIPFGDYEYELMPAPGDRAVENISGSVSVSRSQIHLTKVLGATDSVGTLAQFAVTGILSPTPRRNERVWVIVENVYGRYRQESTVDGNGSFQFDYIWGNNVVIVCAGDEVLLTSPLVVRRDQAIRGMRIDLKTQKIEPRFWE
jgi:hypothetical protein